MYFSYCNRPDIAYAVNKFAKYSNNPGVFPYEALYHLIDKIRGTSHKLLKFYSNMKELPSYEVLRENNISLYEGTVITFLDSSWNDCVSTGGSNSDNLSIKQGAPIEYSSHLPIPSVIFSTQRYMIHHVTIYIYISNIIQIVHNIPSRPEWPKNGHFDQL